MRLFVDMDGVLAKWQVGKDHLIYDKGYFRNLPPNRELINLLQQLSTPPIVVSCYLSDSPYALEEKKAWLEEFFPVEAIFVPYGEDKGEYLRKRGITLSKDTVLLDDHSKNLKEWKNGGGIGLKYLNGINGKGRCWKGLRVNDVTINKMIEIGML